MSNVSPVWFAPLLGGTMLTAMSSASSYYMKEQLPTVKVLGRDFILGAILVLLIMQIVPESVAKLMGFIIPLNFSSIFNFMQMKGGAEVLVPTNLDEMEVRVGVPRF